jgi:hypothetical protein
MNQTLHENLHFCVTAFIPNRVGKGQNATNDQSRDTTARWLFYFLVWAIKFATSGQAAGKQPFCMLLVRSDSTYTSVAVIGLLEDITALLSV